MKYKDKLYTEGCAFSIYPNDSFTLPIVSNSFDEAVSMYISLNTPNLFKHKDGNYVSIFATNPTNFNKLCIPMKCHNVLDFKNYLERNSYCREIRLSLDCNEIYNETYYIVSNINHLPYHRGYTYNIDYALLYDRSSVLKNFGSKIITPYLDGVLYNGIILEGKEFVVDTDIPNANIDCNTDMSLVYAIHTVHFLNKFGDYNSSIIYGEFEPGIPASTMICID